MATLCQLREFSTCVQTVPLGELNVILQNGAPPERIVPVPVKVTVLVPQTKPPEPALFVQLPLTVIFAAVPAAKMPLVMVRLLRFKVVVEPLTDSVWPAVLLTVRLLKVCVTAVPFIAWAPVPLKVTRPVPGVNVPPLLVQLPATFILPL